MINVSAYTVNPLLSSPPPPLGVYLFKAYFRGRLIETGGLFKRGGGLFNLETTMVSVLHKELAYKVEKLKHKKVRGHAF